VDNKQQLRLRAKAIRDGLDVQALSQCLVAQLRNQSYYQNARKVLIYYPLEGEISLLGLLEDDKAFYLPRVEGKALAVCSYQKDDALRCSDWGIEEPVSEAIESSEIDLAIVPALMVDKNNFRLGYGGGYYDRFLGNYPNITSVVLIAKELVVESLPVDECDVKTDFVIVDYK